MTVANDMIKFFKKLDGTEVAINILHVNTVMKTDLYGPKYPKQVEITMTNGVRVIVMEDFDYVTEQIII